ncbi:acetyltransferase [Dothidotthia symphoricarpi CBS 119687]|uniref:Acetyltransferase n=1 Tax=Dothidotthia symphoricarpi CBS 119687 TaxID=1392245 RepID=A0A6A5ZYS6_9PLEO|nr:acetyltransferase [Dothidotthia symphoricarpi CBS 119687]KAF2123558.1 acetyltransferase [Dothidotthia symphoricarpi CBS 119687]
MDKKVWEWRRTIDSQDFLISTCRQSLPHSFINDAFGNAAMFWAKPMSEESLEAMLNNSCTLGLYMLSSNGTKTPIGMARMITDYTTLAYLTDVYVQQSHRKLGLGQWLIHSCRSIALEIPGLRYMVLLTGSPQAQDLYRRELGATVFNSKEENLAAMGARKTGLADAASGSGNGPTRLNA